MSLKSIWGKNDDMNLITDLILMTLLHSLCVS